MVCYITDIRVVWRGAGVVYVRATVGAAGGAAGAAAAQSAVAVPACACATRAASREDRDGILGTRPTPLAEAPPEQYDTNIEN